MCILNGYRTKLKKNNIFINKPTNRLKFTFLIYLLFQNSIREHKVEHFKDFVKGMDESVKVSIARFEEFWDKVARCKSNRISFSISSGILYETIALMFLHRDFSICFQYLNQDCMF